MLYTYLFIYLFIDIFCWHTLLTFHLLSDNSSSELMFLYVNRCKIKFLVSCMCVGRIFMCIQYDITNWYEEMQPLLPTSAIKIVT